MVPMDNPFVSILKIAQRKGYETTSSQESILNYVAEEFNLEDKYKDTDGVKASKLMFDTCGVKYRQLDTSKNKDIRISLKPDVVVDYID